MMRSYLELLKSETCYLSEYDGDNGPVIQGSALGGLNNQLGYQKFLN
jgi:hypothetical protein